MRKTCLYLLPVYACCVFNGAQNVLAADPVSPEFAVQLAKTTLVVGEPLILSFTVKNESGAELESPAANAFAFAMSDFGGTIRDASGSEVAQWRIRGGLTMFHCFRFPPQASLSCNKMVFPYMRMGTKEWRPLGTGEMTVHSWCLWLNQKLVAAPVKISVVPPEGDDVAALEVVRRIPVHFWYMGAEPVPATERLLAEHPQCSYIPYVRFRLAIDKAEKLRNQWVSGQRDAQRQEELARVAEECVTFVETYQGFPLLPRIRLATAQSERLLRKKTSANTRLRELANQEPPSTEIGAMARRLLRTQVSFAPKLCSAANSPLSTQPR